MRRSVILALLGATYLVPRGFKRAFAPPQPPVDQSPSDLGLPEQVTWLESSTGTRLHSWFVPVDFNAPGVVVIHGWGSNSSLMLPLATHLSEAGFHGLFLDARNHGLSEHDDFVSMPRFAEDLDVAIDWLRLQPRVQSVGVIGHSVGGAAAILSASRNAQIEALVAVSAFADPRDVMQRQLSRLPTAVVKLILAAVQRTIGLKFEEFAPYSRIALIESPVLLVHGDQDDVVPIENLHRLASGLPAAEVLLVPGGGHSDLAPYEPFVGEITNFLARSLAAV
jgi:pimeloyl-ACP methyl ester carboxylesterase